VPAMLEQPKDASGPHSVLQACCVIPGLSRTAVAAAPASGVQLDGHARHTHRYWGAMPGGGCEQEVLQPAGDVCALDTPLILACASAAAARRGCAAEAARQQREA
jgi:hypothetical protein